MLPYSYHQKVSNSGLEDNLSSIFLKRYKYRFMVSIMILIVIFRLFSSLDFAGNGILE